MLFANIGVIFLLVSGLCIINYTEEKLFGILTIIIGFLLGIGTIFYSNTEQIKQSEDLRTKNKAEV